MAISLGILTQHFQTNPLDATPSQTLLPHDFGICLHGGATPQPKLATLWHRQPTPGCHQNHQIKRLVVANDLLMVVNTFNTCQYMSILTKSHHVNFVTQLPHVGEITGGDGAWCPNVQRRPIQDPTRLPTVRPASTTLSKSGSGIFDTRRRCNMGSASSSSCGRLAGDSLGLKVWYEFISDLWLMTCLMDTYSILQYLSYLWILFRWAIGNPFLGTSLAPEAFWPEGLHGDTRPATNHTCKAELKFTDLTCFRCNTGQYQAQHIVISC